MTEAGCSSAAGSHSKSFDHSHYRPYQGGGGDSGDALSVTSVSSSGSDLEDVNASFLSDSPEGHERKVEKAAHSIFCHNVKHVTATFKQLFVRREKTTVDLLETFPHV